MSKLRGTAPLLCACLLGACTSTAPILVASAPADRAILAPGLGCAIPPPAAAGGSVDATQTIFAKFRGQTYAFLAQLQITPTEFDFVALDNFGRRAMTAKWTGTDLTFTRAAWLPDQIRPADILVDVAIVYWPEKGVASALSACDVHLGGNDGIRTVSAPTREVMTVHYGNGAGWNRSATLRNLAFGFTIDIQSVELARSRSQPGPRSNVGNPNSDAAKDQ